MGSQATDHESLVLSTHRLVEGHHRPGRGGVGRSCNPTGGGCGRACDRSGAERAGARLAVGHTQREATGAMAAHQRRKIENDEVASDVHCSLQGSTAR